VQSRQSSVTQKIPERFRRLRFQQSVERSKFRKGERIEFLLYTLKTP
jgi:hypothetical protein